MDEGVNSSEVHVACSSSYLFIPGSTGLSIPMSTLHHLYFPIDISLVLEEAASSQSVFTYLIH